MTRPTATRRRSILCRLGVAISLIAAPAVAIGTAPSASATVPTTHAISTTTNPGVDGTGHCQNGNEAVNCNIYDSKDAVWLTGLPSHAGLDSGNYFFAVLVPGGQADPNDGGANNLSDDYDAYTNRTFSIDDAGAITSTGSHDFADNKIRLMPYADTTNPGGVYILAVCSLANGYGVDPSSCKYDAFKVGETEDASPPTVTKTAEGTYSDTWTWGITKDVDKTLVQTGSTATFNYTVAVSHDGGTISDVGVSGVITVFNPNPDDVYIDSVTDVLSDGTVCEVTGGGAQSIPAGDTDFAYTCDLTGLPQGQLDNRAEVSWSNQAVGSSFLSGGFDPFIFSDVGFTGSKVDECVNVTDSYAGALGAVCVGDANPTSFTYSRTIPATVDRCIDYDNTATFTTNDSGTTGSASQSVKVCGKDYGLTMGFWQNKNGQAIITGQAKTGTCGSATWLRQYAPFQDLSATATCAQVGTYVTNVIKAANASGASMNAMLKAQMLATSLDVYFSDPALGGNKISSPLPLGGVKIDLTKICSTLSLSGTCTGSLISTSSAFGGASGLTVNELLAYASSQSNVGGSTWYGQVKKTQELAKDTFDAVNNSLAFVAP